MGEGRNKVDDMEPICLRSMIFPEAKWGYPEERRKQRIETKKQDANQEIR